MNLDQNKKIAEKLLGISGPLKIHYPCSDRWTLYIKPDYLVKLEEK